MAQIRSQLRSTGSGGDAQCRQFLENPLLFPVIGLQVCCDPVLRDANSSPARSAGKIPAVLVN